MDGKLYCGIDFHKNTSTFCIKDHTGKDLELSTVRTVNLVSLLAARKNLVIGIEASGGTNDMVERLKSTGHEVKIINPNKFKAIGIGGKKTDEKDASVIADALRLNYIPEVYHKSIYARRIKSLLVCREMVVRSRVNLMNHTRGILREYGLTIPQGKEAFLEHVASTINKLECSLIKENLLFALDQIHTYLEREKIMEVELKTLAEADSRCKLLDTVPGFGLMSQLAFIAVVDDCARFKDSKHFASYLGLIPREFSSGDKRRMGSITRSGSEILRRYLIHGARTTLMHSLSPRFRSSDPNRQWAIKLKERIGMNKAVVALAHRMARIGFSLLREGVEYNPKFVARKKIAA